MATTSQKTLVGWKAIAGYFSRDERTVMRWAASRGMPVQRVAGQARSSVYAWPEDLDAWLRQAEPPAREPAAGAAEPIPEVTAPIQARGGARSRRWSYRWIGVLAALVLVGLTAAALAMLRRSPDVAPAPAPAIAAAETFHDPVARAAFLQASFDWNLRTRDSLQRAIGEYGTAVAHDPGVAASYVGLANSYLLLREYGAMPEPLAYARANSAAAVAAQLDPNSAEAKRALAFIAFWWQGDIAEARRLFTAAITLAPNDALTRHWYATALSANGEAAAAYREIGIARSLEPTSSAILTDYALIAYMAGHRDEARQLLNTLVASEPRDASLFRVVATIALFEGRTADYLSAMAKAAELRGDTAARAEIAREAEDFRRGGAPLMFERMVDAARTRTRERNDGYFRLAQVAAISGRDTAAIDALAPACTGNTDRAAFAALGDLWLSKAVPPATVRQLCGRGALDAATGARS